MNPLLLKTLIISRMSLYVVLTYNTLGRGRAGERAGGARGKDFVLQIYLK